MPSQPNIVFLFPDQMRRDFLGCYGADFVNTPHMDSIAQNGVRFDRAYSASPVCVPARISLLTGMSPVHNGVTDNLHTIRADYRSAGIRTWPELLNDAGYHTAGIGKMHFYPWDARHGLQHRVIAEDKIWVHIRDDYYHYLRDRGLKKHRPHEHEDYEARMGAVFSPVPWEHSWDRFTGREACRFIKRYGQEQPFAMMVGFPGPHHPYDPAKDFPGLRTPGQLNVRPEDVPAPLPPQPDNTPEMRRQVIGRMARGSYGIDHSRATEADWRLVRAHYAALIEQIEYEVGQILESLRSRGLLDNTVVVLATDHGDYLGDHGLVAKASYYEQATHIPLAVQMPGGPSGTASDALVELSDVTATMLRLAGAETPDYVDAHVLPSLGFHDAQPRDRIVGMLTDGWMLYDGTWKLSKYSTGEETLFNLRDDPQEQRNLAGPSQAGSAADVRKRLDAELTAHIMDAMRRSYHDRLADANAGDPAFGYEGRQIPWPHTARGV